MSVVSVWSGACTDEYVELVAKVTSTSGTARFLLSESPDLTGGTFYGPETVASTGVVTVGVHGLAANTRYYYAVEDVDGLVDYGKAGEVRTHPTVGAPASFTFAAASCAGGNPEYPGPVQASGLVSDRISDHPVFETIAATDPHMFIHMGDLSYYNPGGADVDATDGSVGQYRDAYDAVLSCDRQAALYRATQLVYVWDDHDYGPNDSDGSYALKANAAQVYRERVPSYELAQPSGPIYHAFQVGRVQFVVIDTRYERDPESPDAPGKVMLSATQMAWLDDVLATSTAEALVFVNPTPWMGKGNDTWAGFTEQRAEIADMLAGRGWTDRMIMISGDYHGLAMDSGGGNPAGTFPVYVFAGLDSGFFANNIPDYQYDLGPTSPGNNRWGQITVNDYGHEIDITSTGMIGSTPWRTHSITVPTSTPFSTTFPDEPAPWTVEIAPGGNPVDPSTWVWEDITDFLRYQDRITIGYGRADEWGQVGTTTCGLTLDNRDGRFSPRNPLGPWYGRLNRNTPLRVRWQSQERFVGFVQEWPPRWDQSGRDATAPIQASGILRRLAQGQKALRSSLYREINAPSRPLAVAYWPCEDGGEATRIASAVASAPAMKVKGDPDLASYTGFVCSEPIPVMRNGRFEGDVPSYPVTDETLMRCLVHVPDSGSVDGILVTLICSGSAARWQLHYGPGGTIALSIRTEEGDELQNSGAIGFGIDDRNISLSLEMVQAGANIEWRMLVVYLEDDGTTSGLEWSGTLNGRTVGNVLRVRINPNRNQNDVAIGHVVIANDLSLFANTADALVAHIGETAADRLARLCQEEGVPYTPPAASVDTLPMGPQRTGTLLELLHEAEAADGGTLYETGAGLGYVGRADRYNQPVTLALDVDAGELAAPPEPTDDDQKLRNDVTAQRTGGSSARVVDEASVSREGTYDEQVEVNVSTDTLLGDVASWRLHLGTVDEMRWPKLSLDLATNPHLIESWLGFRLGGRLTVAHAITQLPGVEVDVLVEGWTEILGQLDWRAELNAVPAAPWATGILDDDTYGRIDTDGSALADPIDDAATTFLVESTSGGSPPWLDGSFVPVAETGFVAANSLAQNGVNTFTVPLPNNAGTPLWEEGQFAVVLVNVNDGAVVVTPPAGWTALDAAPVVTGGMVTGAWWKILAPSEPDPVFQSSLFRKHAGAVVVYAGIDPADPIAVVGARGTRGGITADTVAPAVTTTADAQIVIGLFSEKSSATSVTDPTGMTRRAAVFGEIPNEPSALVVDQAIQTAGTTGDRTATYDSSSDTGYGLLVALNADPREPQFDVVAGGEVMTVTEIANGVFVDTFTRDTANGWGSAETGEAWSTIAGAASDYSVTLGVGRVSHTDVGTRRYTTADVDFSAVEFTAQITAPSFPTGNGITAGYVVRYQDLNNYYLFQLNFMTNGELRADLYRRVNGAFTELAVSAAGYFVAGVRSNVRISCVGQDLKFKVWSDTENVEPTDWTVTATDPTFTSGKIGTHSVLLSGNTNPLPVNIHYDNIETVTPQRFTVVRSVNGIQKAHAAGTDVRLRYPMILAL